MAEGGEDSATGSTAVLFLDLDGFKEVNDRHGQAVGDELLRAVSQRLSSMLRPRDSLTRLGGDEFAAIIESLPAGPDGEQKADHIASRLLYVMETPFILAGREIHISASIGVAFGDRRSAIELLRESDVRMYGLKSSRAQHQYPE